MTATVEILAGLNRRLTLNVNQAAIEAEVSKRLSQVARTVRMDGFRPGKAPKNLVAARYSGEIRNEVFGDALQQEFSAAIQANNLHVAGYPQFAPAEGGGFNATFEVMPERQTGRSGADQGDASAGRGRPPMPMSSARWMCCASNA
jgi:trigger factor